MKLSLTQVELDAIKASGFSGSFTLDTPGPVLPSPGPGVPVPSPGHTVTLDPPYAVTGNATMFGLNWNGSIDSGDNGIGFFINPASNADYQTRSRTLVGCSLPREVMLSTFLGYDDWQTMGIATAWAQHAMTLLHWVSNNQPLVTIDSGGHTDIGMPIVDAGPTASTHNAIDLTYAVARQLNTQGLALATYMIVLGEAPMVIKGWDFATKRVLGS